MLFAQCFLSCHFVVSAAEEETAAVPFFFPAYFLLYTFLFVYTIISVLSFATFEIAV